ncbi:Na+/H+ antiporter [Nakamurella sp. PAMC28650]|uniref:Na+/H+ antiporter n=1 Tax=Nakamurella sp. PAMC28650 TaxID=2762325 RepID=UPI00164EADDA|nr:Na+/H+ antiporter [Nakamurella sp. PAMC28650]QNK79940.1 Na+/H+ antiporter [Nakamurella sp. PAMC28650]
MTHILIFVVAGVAVVLVVELIAERTRLPAAALLTAAGLIYALLPGTNIELDPQVILTFVLPPLLYSAALNSSLLAIRKNLRPVISLSVGLVLATALLVGVGIHLFLPAISLAAGIALGAAVAPPDPVAALAIGRRAGLPPRLITLIEGEGLLNDATALTTFTVAVVAATTGGFSVGMFGLRFLLAAVGGLAVGMVVALFVRLVRSRVNEPVLVNSLSLITPFAAYLFGEEIHVSGVLAVVVAGLVIGHDTPRFSSGASRLQTTAVWRLIDFLLEGFVFILIGQQLPRVLTGLEGYPTSTIVAGLGVTLGVVLLLRPIWLVVTQFLPPRLHTRLGGGERSGDGALSGREVLIMSWSGTRGVITLAAIFSLPLVTDGGAPFPGRDLLLLCAYAVVLVTLIGQGLTFAPIVRATGIRADAAGEALERNEVRTAAAHAGLARLEQLAEDQDTPDEAVRAMRAGLELRLERYQRRADILEGAENGEIPVSPTYEAALTARRAIIDAQRDELLRWRDAGRLTDSSLRILERELDLEEFTLPHRDGH